MQTYQLSICPSLIIKKSIVYSLHQTNKIQLFIKVVLKKWLREAVFPFVTLNTLLIRESNLCYLLFCYTRILSSLYFILVGTYFEQLLDFTNKFESKQQRSNSTNILCHGNTISARMRLQNCYVQFHGDINRVKNRRCRCHSRLCKRIVRIIWTVGTRSDRGLKAQGNRDRNNVKCCCDCVYAATLKASI